MALKAIAAGGKSLVILGAGGHAKVLLSLARAAGLIVAGVCDPLLERMPAAHWRGVPVLGGDAALDTLDPRAVELINGVGKTVGSEARRALFDKLRERGFGFATLVHPAAVIDPTAILGHGVQIMAGAVVQADCRVGDDTIVNTCASIDHDCVIGSYVHIAPGATLCGAVCVHDGAFIASGATVLPGLTVGAESVVAAGATLTRDLAPAATSLRAQLQPDAANGTA
jgi:sugar O-acyltransferase (sialic acid O-acetyltransferase NeuD family)